MAKRSRGGAVRIFPGRFRGVKGVEGMQKWVASLPAALIAPVKESLELGAKDMVAAIKPIVPTSNDLEARPGELRDSVHWEPGDHELAVVVLEDGVDAEGKPIGKHVEHGHKAKDGSHVAAAPHFWPGYNVTKKRVKARVGRGVTKGVKALQPPPAPSS